MSDPGGGAAPIGIDADFWIKVEPFDPSATDNKALDRAFKELVRRVYSRKRK